jgi:DNA-binding SARP family transcriptional activator/tetratricopeptide (TPR) repeat protein
VRFGLLGSLEVADDAGAPVDVGGAQPRTVLALLLGAAGRVVTGDALVDALWPDEPPPSAAGTIQSYISRLRRALEPVRGRGAPATVLVREPAGYRLAVDAEAVDFRRFEHLADEGRALLAAGRAAEGRDALVAADALWRGPALVEFGDVEPLVGLATRLEERRLAAAEERVAADLALGRHAAVVGELTGLVAAHPLREGLRGHLALALYRSGRQAEALRSLDDARRVLRDELGVELSRPLRELEQAILAHDTGLDRAPAAAPDPAPAPAPVPPPPLSRAAAPAPAGSGLVGRDAELAQLRAALDEVVTGTARVVVVEGEPGIGKTRLAEELGAEAAARGAAVHWGRAFEGGAAPAFWPWLPPLRALAEARLPGAPLLPAELAALVAPAGRGDGAGPGGEAGSGGGFAELARFSLVEAVVGLLAEAATARPVVLVLDDLQWADTASLELLAATMARVPETPVLVIVTVRELEVGRHDAVVDTLAALTRRTGTRRLRLRGLSGEGTAALVARTTGRPADDALVAAVHTRAEGNPFFTTELAHLVAGGDDLASADVPSGVRDVVRRRLAGVPDASRELLQAAAILGRDVDVALLAKAVDRDLDRCLDELEPALVHRLLVEAPADRGADPLGQVGLYRFTHALVREVLVEDTSPLRRARLHRKVAEALDDSDDLAEIVAEHYWNAVPTGVGVRAAQALERAAAVAVHRLAYGAAHDLLERAVRLRRAAGAGPGAAEAELNALARLVSVIGASQGYASLVGQPLLARGRQLAEQTGMHEELLYLLWAEWAGLDVACQYERADPIAHDLLRLAEEMGSPVAAIVGHTAVGISSWHRGDLAASARHLDMADAGARALGPGAQSEVLVDLDQLSLAIPFSACIHALRGELDDPEATFDAIVRRVPGNRYWELLVMNFAASAGLSTSDLDRSVRAGRRGMAADPDGISAFWSMALRAYLGAALCRQGHLDEGLAVLDDAWARYTAMGLRTNGVTLLSSRAQGLAEAGRLPEAETSLADARREFERYSETFAEPTLLMAEAAVHHARGETDAARAALDRAVERAEAIGGVAIAAGIRTTGGRLGI